MKIARCMAGVITVLWLVSCAASPDEASNETFTKVLNAHYETFRECFPIATVEIGQEFLMVVEVADDSKILGAKRNARDLKPFLALANAGIMTATDTTISKPFFSQTRQLPAKGFNLTGAGTVFVQPKALNRGADKDVIQLCYGRRDIIEIVNFTAPTVSGSASISHVKYRYRLAQVPDWARLPELQSRLGSSAGAIDAVLESSDDLVLSDSGWVHSSEFE